MQSLVLTKASRALLGTPPCPLPPACPLWPWTWDLAASGPYGSAPSSWGVPHRSISLIIPSLSSNTLPQRGVLNPGSKMECFPEAGSWHLR